METYALTNKFKMGPHPYIGMTGTKLLKYECVPDNWIRTQEPTMAAALNYTVRQRSEERRQASLPLTQHRPETLFPFADRNWTEEGQTGLTSQ